MADLTGKRVAVISDLHLTKNFSGLKFNLLKEIIENSGQLIINGDLWEGFGMSFGQFVSSDWRRLFSLFKQKKAVYIFGNHDPSQKDQAAYGDFCDEVVDQYDFVQNGVKFHVTHGDFFDPTLDMRHPNLPRFILNWGSQFERLFISLLGRKYLNIYRESNNKMKRWHQAHPTNGWLICGHSHLPEVDEPNRFANSGIFLKSGLASYLLIENGRVVLRYC